MCRSVRLKCCTHLLQGRRRPMAKRARNGSASGKRRDFIRTVEAKLPTRYGNFRAIAYEDAVEGRDHLAIIKGDVRGREDVLVRVHSECLTADALGSLRCDCGEQLRKSMRAIEKKGRGIILYLRQEGRGIGLLNKVRAYHMQDQGIDTVAANVLLGFEPDERSYDGAAYILNDLGVKSIVLLTNNPDKVVQLKALGVKVKGREPLRVKGNRVNSRYLSTKKRKMGHILDDD